MRGFLLAPVLNWARKLRQPALFGIIGALFLVTLVLPDPLPLVDEILLGLVTMGLANWKRRALPAEDPSVVATIPPRRP